MDRRHRVVVVMNNFLVGGVERLFSEIIPRLDRNRMEVMVATVWGSGPLEQLYRRLDIPIYFAAGRLPYSSKNPLLKLYFGIISPVTFVRLLWLFLRWRPDTVITCLTQADILGISAAWVGGVSRRIIRQADSKPLSPVVGWIKRSLAIRLATGVVANSTDTRQFVQSYFGVLDKLITVIPNGIDLSHFVPNMPVREDRESVVGFLGRLEEIKGAPCFIRAIDILQHNFKLSPPVMVYGDGSLGGQLREYASFNGLGQVRFNGAASDPAVALRDIDILVVPSISEGFGLVTLEGLVMGKVVIASDLPVMRDLITNHQNGLLFPADDAMALAGIVAELLQHPESLLQIRQGVREWVAKHSDYYDIESTAARYEEVLLNARPN